MPRNRFEAMLSRAQEGFTPDLQKAWGELLGLSGSVLVDLGCGYIGDVHEGIQDSLVWAELDDKGEITGLCCRGRDGKKAAVTGSKRGLCYIPREGLSSVGVEPDLERCLAEPCPLCGKTGECKSSDTYILCAHVHEGPTLVKRVQNASLHRFGTGARGVLAARFPDDAVVVVEGLSDTATAMGLGFDGLIHGVLPDVLDMAIMLPHALKFPYS